MVDTRFYPLVGWPAVGVIAMAFRLIFLVVATMPVFMFGMTGAFDMCMREDYFQKLELGKSLCSFPTQIIALAVYGYADDTIHTCSNGQLCERNVRCLPYSRVEDYCTSTEEKIDLEQQLYVRGESRVVCQVSAVDQVIVVKCFISCRSFTARLMIKDEKQRWRLCTVHVAGKNRVNDMCIVQCHGGVALGQTCDAVHVLYDSAFVDPSISHPRSPGTAEMHSGAFL